MNETLASLLGGIICCVVPIAMFAAGVAYARYGLPVSISWRGFRHEGEGGGEGEEE